MSNNKTNINEQNDRINLVKKIHGYQLSQLIAVVVRLKIFEHLNKQPQNYLELAELTNTNQDILLKLLKILANEKLLQEIEEGIFELTACGRLLTKNNENSLYGMALLHGSQFFWSLWSKLDYTATTGKPVIDNFSLLNFPIYMAQNQLEASIFQDAMLNIEMQEATQLLKNHSFPPFKSVIDIGGGARYLLTNLLQHNPQSQGIAVSLTDTEKNNPINAENLKKRTQWIQVNFSTFALHEFKENKKANLCIIRHVARNLNDSDLVRFLQKCTRLIHRNGMIILIEVLNTKASDIDDGSIHLLRDLYQRLNFHGIKQRDSAGYYFLAKQSGLIVENIVENSASASIIKFSLAGI